MPEAPVPNCLSNKKHEGKKYCVLHFPGTKGDEFTTEIRKRFDAKNYDFAEVYFPSDVDFFGLTFPSEARFEEAVFCGAANFGESIFEAGANFAAALFRGDANFGNARFNGAANFSSAQFEKRAVFDATTFSEEALLTFVVFTGEADFQRASFAGLALFDYAVVKDTLTFGSRRDYKHTQGFGETAALSMSGTRIESPENVSFQTLSLCPRWFINVDVRKLNFVEVEWNGVSKEGFNYKLDKDIQDLENNGIEIPNRLLAITYRQLAVNAEENHRYREASTFRYLSMEARRTESVSFRALLTLDWWYWLASGYGERIGKAFVVLVLLCLIFGVAYRFTGFTQTNPGPPATVTAAPIPTLSSAIIYSFQVVTLQRPDPKPLTPTTQALVTLETVLGTTQLALLALAIRRKYMR